MFDGQTRGGAGGIGESSFGRTEESTSYIEPLHQAIQCHDGCMRDFTSQRSTVLSESVIAQDSGPESDNARLAADPLGVLFNMLGIRHEVMSNAKKVLLKSTTVRSDLGVSPTDFDLRVAIMELDGPDDAEVMVANRWADFDFEDALHAGSQYHVCDLADCPGYYLEASPVSRRGGCFMIGNGARLQNRGQAVLNQEPEADGSTSLRACFQVAKVTQPLMSFGRMCDNKMRAIVDNTKAVVETLDGALACVI